MRKLTLLFASALLLLSSYDVRAQAVSLTRQSAAIAPRHSEKAALSTPSQGFKSFPSSTLSSLVNVAGAHKLPISGKYHVGQSNGRALHNLQVDPENPNRLHALIMTDTANSTADTTGGGYVARRLYYTFSSDGGVTWTPRVDVVRGLRTGFGDMILIKRNGNYIPVIAGHRREVANQEEVVSFIAIESGAPGAGKFVRTDASRESIEGSDKDIIWPSIAAYGNKIYIMGAIFVAPGGQPEYPEFGSFTLGESGTASFDGWASQPTKEDATDIAGYTSGGDHVLRISATGKIGIMWHQPFGRGGDWTHYGLYYIESTDGGNTWTNEDLSVPFAGQDEDDFISGETVDEMLTASGSFDFFYAGETPRVVWKSDYSFLSVDEGSTKLGYTTLQFRDGVEGATRKIAGPADVTNPAPHRFPNLAPYYPGARYEGYIDYVTVAPTSDPNTFAAVFNFIQAGDTAITGPQGDVTDYNKFGYSSIYYTMTNDGGKTWSEPGPYRANPLGGAQSTKADYRWPSVSHWNPGGSGTIDLNVMYAADDSAGAMWGGTGGYPGWTEVTFWHEKKSVSMAGVSDTALSVAPLMLKFPTTTSGTPVRKSFVISNTSSSPVDLPVTVGAPTDAAFKVIGNTSLTAKPGIPLTVEVEFMSSTAGAHSGSLLVSGPRESDRWTIQLSADVSDTVVTIEPTTIEFGTAEIGATVTRTITVTNNSPSVNEVTVNVGSLSAPFSVSSGVVTVSKPTPSSIEVTFQPTAAGPFSATLTITGPREGESTDITLTGTGATSSVHTPRPRIAEGVYPNPSMGSITLPISAEGVDRVVLVDALGREVEDLTSTVTARGGSLSCHSVSAPAGAYLVHATGKGISVSYRLVVVR